MKLSVLMPVYNENKTVLDVLELIGSVEAHKEIILVDDFSDDGTRELLKEKFGDGAGNIKVIYHDRNRGKGAAIRTAIGCADGDYMIVQDADMEYSPGDMENLVDLAAATGARAVYGSRFARTWRTTSLPHFVVNWSLTALTNLLFGGALTDMETCYKLIKSDDLRSLDIKAERFEFGPEVTAKLLKKGIVIHEIPVYYRGRGYDAGKKITWKDGVETLITLIRLRFSAG